MKKKHDQNKARRAFIRNSSLAAAGFFIVPRHVLGGKGFIAPSDKLNLAGIGVGGKGSSDITNAWNKGSENVVALCDIDWNYAKGIASKFPDAKKYNDYRKMFDEMGKSIDAVTISTPDHMHAPIAMAAIQMGKHVYVQKPLTHDIYEARKLTEAARRYKIVSQMGNQGASSPGSAQLVEWFDKGLIGKVDTAYIWTNRPVWPQGIPMPAGKPLPEGLTKENWDLWVGAAPYVDYDPLYHPFKWRGWWNFGTGALGDMGCHLIDPAFRVLGLGYPTEVECSVGQIFIKDWNPEYIPDGCPPSSNVQLKFPKSKKNNSEVKMIWNDGGIRPFHPDLIPADDFIGEPGSENGGMLIGEKGIITFGTYGMTPQVYLKDGTKLVADPNKKTEIQKMPESGHQYSWIQACKAGFESKEHKVLTSSFDYSGPLTETVLMGNLAIRSYTLRNDKKEFKGRKKLLWDGTNMKITNFDEANQFVKRTYRDGWTLGA